VLYAGLVVGTLDLLAAFASFFISTGNNPLLILKAITSGVRGRAAFSGGGGTLLLGLGLHFFIALSFTALFFWLYRRVGFISRHKVAAGVLYGLFIWAVMNLLVLPLSQVAGAPFQPFHALREALILVLMMGVPLVFLAGRHFESES
jgi:hypothetical protein